MRLPRVTFTSCLAGAASLVLVPAAWANFAPRFWGDATSEPWGLKDVAIAQERLTIDLRPLSDANLVRVEVMYDLSNAGVSKHLDLLFISGEVGVRDFEAQLGGQPLRTRLLSSDEVHRLWEQSPPSWRPPAKAPGIERERTYYTFGSRATPPELVAFSLELPPGPSTLHVGYRARACGTAERPTVTWQLPYVLAPAREWGRFGRLDVTVHLPVGWEARSTPALQREGDTLRRSFTEIPADALLLAAGAPVPSAYYWAILVSETICAALLVVGPLVCWWAGRRLGGACASGRGPAGEATGRGVLRGLGLGIFPALLWGALLYASVPVSMGIIRTTLHGQENPEFGDPWFAGPCLTCFIIPAAVLFGVALAMGSASRVARHNPANTPTTVRHGSVTGRQQESYRNAQLYER
jgi:hypothetical protein